MAKCPKCGFEVEVGMKFCGDESDDENDEVEDGDEEECDAEGKGSNEER